MSKRLKRPIELLSITVMLIVCCGGRVYGVMPFGAAMFCAASGEAFIGLVAPVYLVCSFLFTFELWRLYTAGAVIVLMTVRWFLALKFKRFGSDIAKIMFTAAAILVETVISGLFVPVTNAVISGFIGIVFYYFARRAVLAASRKFSFRLSATEAAAVCVVLAVFGLSFGRAAVDGVNIGLAPSMLLALMLGVIGVTPSLAGGISIGLGLAFGFDYATALAFAACVAISTVFRTLARPLRATAAVGVFAAFAVLFGKNAIEIGFDGLMLAAGALVFIILPKRTVRRIEAYFDFDGTSRLALRHYINRIKADAGNRMLAVSEVFDETARLMNVFAAPPPDFNAMGEALMDKICPYCTQSVSCDKAAALPAFAAAAERAFSGKPIITELPEFFSESCARTVDVIGAAGEITDAARARAQEIKTEDKAKAIVTERLVAIKDVLEGMGESEAAPVGFDAEAERKIVSELNLRGVECAEVFCARDSVTAVVRTQSAVREKIRRAVKVCLKRDYEVIALDKTQAAGWSVATLKKRPAYEAVYARAGVSKSGGISGDSYTFERIGDKFLVALLDGMGSGERAASGSSAAIELIECFYKAGFDSQSALSGVNRFLKLPTAENYSAADVAVCDLDSASIDIFKIGAPPCYIKTTDTVLRIEGGALPIGVLDEMRPYAVTKRLYPGQMLIMVTDGVSDCFSGDELPEFINGLKAFNPEAVANAVLRRALDLVGDSPRDDMTVVAFRLFDAPKKLSHLTD